MVSDSGGDPDGNGEFADGEPERQRLHRRDTPHHLKNKRINQPVSTSKSFQAKNHEMYVTTN